MSNPTVTKISKLIAAGPAGSKMAVTKLSKFIVVDTTSADSSGGTVLRKRVQGSIRYGDAKS